MGNFSSNSIKNNFLVKIYWGHLGYFGPDSNFYNYYNPNCELIP